MKKAPPFEPEVDYSAYDISAEWAAVRRYDCPVDEADGGYQRLPVGIYQPDTKRLADDHLVVRGFAWSASNHPPYQRARTQFWTDAYGINTVAPNTIGQGIGSPDLTKKQKEELSRGKAFEVGRVMITSALETYKKYIGDIGRLVLLGDSQFPALLPGIVAGLPEGIDLSQIIMLNPSGTEAFRNVSGTNLEAGIRLGAKLRSSSGNFEAYRARNPAEIQSMRDTNANVQTARQFGAHVLYYPRLISYGSMPEQLKKQLDERGLKPEIHVISSENDLCSMTANEEAARILDANHTVKYGHDHAYGEYIPAVAKDLADILK